MRHWLLFFGCWVAPLSAQTPDSVRTYKVPTTRDSTVVWRTRVDTVVRVKTDTVARADTTPKPLPSVTRGVYVGPSHYPLSSFGSGPYNAGVLTVNASSLLSDLAKAKAGKAHLVLAIPLSQTTVPDTTWRTKVDTVKHDTTRVVASVSPRLSVKASASELKRWPDIAPFVADGTVIAVYVGDDVTDKTLWGPLAPYWAKYDSIGAAVKARWPKAPVALRSKPTDMAGYKPWRSVSLAWGQYSHIPRDGEPLNYAQTQWASAKAQGLCLILGLNAINGGDGSSKIAGSQVGRFEMTGAEVLKYGSVFLRFTPAIIWWEYRAANHARIVDAVTQLRAVADTTPAVQC